MAGALRGVSWCLAFLAMDWVAESGVFSRGCSALLGWLPNFPTRAVIPMPTESSCPRPSSCVCGPSQSDLLHLLPCCLPGALGLASRYLVVLVVIQLWVPSQPLGISCFTSTLSGQCVLPVAPPLASRSFHLPFLQTNGLGHYCLLKLKETRTKVGGGRGVGRVN